jgi:hypothetical protein
MINLIPQNAQRQLRAKRFQSALAAFGFFMMAILAVGFVMLLPSFIALRFMIADFSYAREAEERSPVSRALEERTRALADLEALARNVLARARTTPSFDDMARETLRIAPAGIDFEVMRFEKKAFILEGRYQHRSLFLAFLNALPTIDLVKDVSSPLSNLLKETDAPFFITLSL